MEVKELRTSFGEGSAAFQRGKALVAELVTSPGRLRYLVDDDAAMIIWHEAVTDRQRWPALRAMLLARGHTEADLEYVGERSARFALDVAQQVRKAKR